MKTTRAETLTQSDAMSMVTSGNRLHHCSCRLNTPYDIVLYW